MWFAFSDVALLGGVILFAHIFGDGTPPAPTIEIMKTAPVPLVFAVAMLVPLGEALLWTVLLVEGAGVFFGAAWIGALSGIIAYSVVYHANAGTVGIVCSAWIALVSNASYLILRRTSRWLGYWWVVGLRWTFVTFALLLVWGVV